MNFSIWPLGMELWDKTFNFKDNKGMSDHLGPLLVNEFLKPLAMELWDKSFNFEDK